MTTPLQETRKISCPECHAWFKIGSVEQVPPHQLGSSGTSIQCSGSYKTPMMSQDCQIVKEWKPAPAATVPVTNANGQIVGTASVIPMNTITPKKLDKPEVVITSDGTGIGTRVIVTDGITEIDISHLISDAEVVFESASLNRASLTFIGVKLDKARIPVNRTNSEVYDPNTGQSEMIKDNPWDIARKTLGDKENG